MIEVKTESVITCHLSALLALVNSGVTGLPLLLKPKHPGLMASQRILLQISPSQ